MKKPSQRDIGVALVIAFFTALLTWAITAMYYHNSPVMVENTANEGLKKRGDSLEAVIVQRDSAIWHYQLSAWQSDSILAKNHKSLKNQWNEIENFDTDSRRHYIDSILKGAGKR